MAKIEKLIQYIYIYINIHATMSYTSEDEQYYSMDEDSVSIDEYSMNMSESDDEDYDILRDADVKSRSKRLITEVMEILDLDECECIMLLHKFSWDKEKLIENYFGEQNENIKVKECNEHNEMSGECMICLTSQPFENMFNLSCNHAYCKDCWREYLETAIDGKMNCIITKCPYPKCDKVVNKSTFKSLISQEKYKIYKKHWLRFIIENNQQLKACPSPFCNNKIYCKKKTLMKPIRCTCGFAFCYKCADYDIGNHLPIACDQVDSWLKQLKKENETVTWMLKNTKKCPKCMSPIEKNGGCLHMTCKKCKHEFCWLCKGSWSSHGDITGGYYKCNSYETNKDQYTGTEFNRPNSTENLFQYYMFYLHRYETYAGNIKYLQSTADTINIKANKLLDKFQTAKFQDMLQLKDAFDQIIDNTNTLKWSYVYGYYIPHDNQVERNLFEHLQESLERYNTLLSEEFEKDVSKVSNFDKYMHDIKNYINITRKFNDNFINGVLSGLVVDD